jgi:hypothetical protein
MSVPSVAEILKDHVTLEVESLDRVYLNLYIPQLQREPGVAWFLREHRGYPYASSAVMKPISDRFVAAIKRFAKDEGIPLVRFKKGQRKDDVTQEHLKRFEGEEGPLYIGVAQEKAPVVRTTRKYTANGVPYPWLYRSTAMVNYYYLYLVDRHFGPLFIKFCSYFPYNGKVCLNGHEYLKRQLEREGIGYEPLDNGILSCEDPERMQALCDGLTEETIQALVSRWLEILPHPFTPEDREAGYTYQLSILQIEFALTQVFDRPLSGRQLFEQILRENLDLGRPDHVQLIFDRRVTRRTPGRFRTRVITYGVTPTLHIDYKRTRIKQYFKLGRALRTEVTIHNTYDFDVGKLLKNLPLLRHIGFAANRRLLDVQRLSYDCTISQEVFDQVVRPIQVAGQRASALRFDDRRVQALFSVLVMFCWQPHGLRRRDLQEPMAHLLGIDPAEMTGGRLTYDLRRLRLHGIIERIEGTHRYRLTAQGLRVVLFFSRVHARLLRPSLARIMPQARQDNTRIQKIFRRLDQEIERSLKEAKLAA